MTDNEIYIKELDLELIQPSTNNFEDPTQGGSKTVVIGKPGCFEKGTKILMHNGLLKNVEDVVVGDVIMGDDSTERNVLQLCHNYDIMYKIIPLNGGNPYVVNRQHKLVISNNENIEEISVANFLEKSQQWQNNSFILKTGVKFPEKNTNKFPYLFGLSVTDKIPNEYKINSENNRLSLLAGIIDSIGSFCHKTLKYIIKTDNKQLLEDINYLCLSLGFHSYIQNNNCFLIPNKKIPCKNKHIFCFNTSQQKSKFTVKELGKDEYYGFTIDKNHRFLLGSFDIVRNTGKTTLISSLLYAKKHIFPIGMVVSGTEDSNGYYSKIFPETFIYNSYVEEDLRDFIRRQKLAKKHIKNPWGVILLDDSTDDPRIFNKPIQHGMYKNGRHWKMWYILSLQYCMDVKPVIRTNVDGVFILREPNMKNRRNLWENYAGVIPDFTMFCDIMDQLTDDYTALYIHNATISNKLEDCLFFYKATPIPEGFKFGCQEYWEFHYARFNPDYVAPLYTS